MRTVLMNGLLVAGLVLSAEAIEITPSGSVDFPLVLTGNDTGNDKILTAIEAKYPNLDELYKKNNGGVEEMTYAGSYETVFNTQPALPNNDFTLSYITGPVINSAAKYLLVKDGNSEPAWYLFDISDWNGTEIIQGSGFWPNKTSGNGAISHVSIFGGTGDDHGGNVPDGGMTLAMLGAAIGALGAAKRKLLC